MQDLVVLVSMAIAAINLGANSRVCVHQIEDACLCCAIWCRHVSQQCNIDTIDKQAA